VAGVEILGFLDDGGLNHSHFCSNMEQRITS